MSVAGEALPVGTRVILRATVGSNVHGVAVGADDRDELGVCIEPPECVIGLRHFETYVWRTKPEGVRSEAGDLDLTIHSLRKFARLAAKGNPTILMLLFVPSEHRVDNDGIGSWLLSERQMFIARNAGRAFLGYLTAQKERLLGERGQKRTKRPELVEEYGYDTKYAGHMIRLGIQGIELLETGKITLPMPDADVVLAVRNGEWDLQKVLTRAGELERDLEDLLDTSPLPEKPNYAVIDDFLVNAYQEAWHS